MVSAQTSEEPPSYSNLTKRVQVRDIDLAGPYFVANHRDGSVKLATFPDLSSARTFYDEVLEDFQGKILVDKSKAREVTSQSHGGSSQSQRVEFINKCEEVVQNVGNMALNYFVVFHKDSVRRAAFVDLPSAWTFYESVPNSFAKVLIDTTTTEALTVAIHDRTQYTKQCKDVGNSINNSTPLCKSPYGVAIHRNKAVAVAYFDDSRSAQGFYDVISNDWAKVLVERSPSGVVSTLACHGESKYTSQCTARILDSEDTTPLRETPCVVLFHHKDTVRTAFCHDHESAQSLFDAIVKPWAKVFLDRGKTEASELAVNVTDKVRHDLIRQCRTSIEQAGFPPTLEAATYVVAFNQKGTIRMAGCIDEPSAEAFYQVIPNEWAKILKHRSHAGELLASDGDTTFVKKCEFVVHKLPCVS